MGLEKDHGVLPDDVKLALRGHMRDGYEVQLLQTAGVLVHSKWDFFHSEIHLHLFSSSILFLSCQRIISSTMKLRLTTTKSRFWLVSFLPTQWAACLMKFCRRFETSGRKPAAWVRVIFHGSHFSCGTFNKSVRIKLVPRVPIRETAALVFCRGRDSSSGHSHPH